MLKNLETSYNLAIIENLLKYILPSLFEKQMDEVKNIAFHERRFNHPELFQTYFNYTAPEDLKDIDELLDAIAENKDINAILLKYNNLLEQQNYWSIFLDGFRRQNGPRVFLMITKGLARNSTFFSDTNLDHHGDGWGTRIEFAQKCFFILNDEEEFIKKFNEEAKVHVINDIIGESSCYGFAANFLMWIIEPSYFSFSSNIKLSEECIEKVSSILQNKCLAYFEHKNIFNVSECADDFLGAIDWTPVSIPVKDLILKQLSARPKKIFQILDLYTSVSNRGEIVFPID